MKHGFRLLQDIIPDAILMAAEDIADYDEEIEESTPKKREKKGKKSKNGEVVAYKAHQPAKPAPALIKSAAYIEPKLTPVSPPKPAFDDSRIHVGTKVFHKAFGYGIIKTLNGSRLTVVFGDMEKPFVFPGAFLQGFLKIEE